MTIEVDSTQWTGQPDDHPMASPIVWGEFAERAALDRAAERLQQEDWFRQSRAGATSGQGGTADNAGQVDVPDEHPNETGQRGLRQNLVGIGTYAASTLAAGVVIATGGAALPAVAAAAAAGAAAAGAGELVGTSADNRGSGEQSAAKVEAPRSEGPALGIKAASQEVQRQAEGFLKQAGASRVWVQATPGG